jgi:hypothetical protein
MTMPDERHPESRGEIDVSIAVGIDHVCAPRFDPDDRIMTRTAELFPSLAPSRERWALSRREAFYPGSTGGRGDRVSNGWKCVAELHAGVLARRLRRWFAPCRLHEIAYRPNGFGFQG